MKKIPVYLNEEELKTLLHYLTYSENDDAAKLIQKLKEELSTFEELVPESEEESGFDRFFRKMDE